MRRFVSGTFAIATALSSAACYSMRPVTFGELGTARPGAVWITKADQSVVVVETPRVFGDTLTGYIDGEFQELQNTTDLKQFLVRRMAGAKTASLVAAAMLGAGTFAFLVSSTEKHVDPASLLDCEDDPDQPGCPGAVP